MASSFTSNLLVTRRPYLATANKREENLINAYEAEEERIINVLSRKLEQLREEKIDLENALEAESESHVNRLSRELSALRLAQQQQLSGTNGSISASPEMRVGLQTFMSASIPTSMPSAEVMLEAMRRENEHLRNRLVDTERDYIRISRLNEIYREELIEHRRRLGLPVDNLIGLSSVDPYSQPTHRRSVSNMSSPSTSVIQSHTSRAARPVPGGVPIPRPPSQLHRPIHNASETNTPLSHSPSSSESPFPFSPLMSTNPASFVSNSTQLTSPPSSASFSNPPAPYPPPSHTLTYPVVPPPSLSSSFGSPTVSLLPRRDHSLSPVDPASRRNSNARGNFERRRPENGSYASRSQSRRGSVERGARVAETGTLVPRSRASSQSSPLASTAEAPLAHGLQHRRLSFVTMSYQFPYNVGGYSSTPTTPRTTYPWEDQCQQPEQHQNQQQQQQQDVYSASPPAIIQLQEQVPIVPSQNPVGREGESLRMQHSASAMMSAHGRPEGPSGDMRPLIHVDTTRSVHASSSPPSAGGMSGPGPIRARVSPTHTDVRLVSHPYMRPQSAGGSGGANVRHRREHEHNVRFTGQPSTHAMPAPATTSGRTASRASATGSASSSLISPSYHQIPLPDNRPSRFIIRTDVHYNSETNTLTAMLELPGLKKTDLSIVLSRCPYNRVKQVVVSGRSRPVLPDNGYAVKERKFGDFTRTLVVPSETKKEDLSAEMQDGILTIKISCGPTAESEGSQEIAIQ
ncbi:hypothetical protein SERLA73DRAFT_165123 [Serpula lacrymans var. lacrymans S7.3]|uniref:SHSP domain-containing protein n=2 Tax=Serpula lacrymans var. lacrymans TaxID=341189 RepID=F8PJ60_SERL3|nr:putative heatshock protein [Serpula lacrymans var. lacrymans S7.9]EGO03424.1 hypothetical protein SERLA73DRAFT_165123 [Serpula lacrymans var. lacrymans S7.3]EGO30098.1 putative heatshock protein [Serpula lacrymans var. lacrymans S7.9]